MVIDENEVAKALSLLKQNDEVFEIRILADKEGTYSAYFNNIETAIKQLKVLNVESKANVYITLQSIKKACYSKTQRDRFVKKVKSTTSDADVENYQWLFVDLDPKRSTDTSSSDEELDYAKQKANEIYAYLKNKGFSEPIIALSGNGVHLLYSVRLLVTKDTTELVKKFLQVLSMLFSDEKIDVDTANFNPARICKLYGTIAEKGSNTKDRPHRKSKIVRAPQKIENTDINLIKEVVKVLPEPEKVDYRNYGERFNLEDFITKYGIQVKRVVKANGVTKYILDHCLFNPEHKAPDSAIIQLDNGAIAYNCFHNGCSCHRWQDVRLMFEPDAYNRQYVNYIAKPNYSKLNYQITSIQEYEKDLPESDDGFLTVEELSEMEKNEPVTEFMKTGIEGIDNKLRGLQKGFVSVISGLRGSGKSSLVSQIALNLAEEGYKVAIYSGELKPTKTWQWLRLQCAGKNEVRETQTQGFYEVTEDAKNRVKQWLNDKIYIYNNKYGHNFEKLKISLDRVVANRKVDLIILDNLMTMDITMLDSEKYQQQSRLVGLLEIFAKNNNVHIILIAHPRKSLGFLRLEDISGSNDIVNKVDNAFIVHRVNNDFRRLSKEMFKWNDDNELYHCSNVIEICKDRETGHQDEFIPLYFEPACKRLMNKPYENKVYSWVNILPF